MVFLVDDEVKVIKVFSSCECFFASIFRQDTVEFCCDDQLLPRTKPVDEVKG